MTNNSSAQENLSATNNKKSRLFVISGNTLTIPAVHTTRNIPLEVNNILPCVELCFVKPGGDVVHFLCHIGTKQVLFLV